MRALFHLVAATASLAALSSVAPDLTAQSIWIDQRASKGLSLEILKTDFDGNANTTVTTSTVFMSAWFPISQQLRVAVELPFAHVGTDFQSNDAVGNPYLGIQAGSAAAGFSMDLGMRVPLASEQDDARFVGFLSDIDRWEAFSTNYVPIMFIGTYRYRAAEGIVASVRAGPSLWLHTNDGDAEALLAYSGQVGYEDAAVSILAGFTGRAILTEENLYVGEATIHQFGLGASVRRGLLRPGAYMRIPVDADLAEAISAVFGLSLTVTLP